MEKCTVHDSIDQATRTFSVHKPEHSPINDRPPPLLGSSAQTASPPFLLILFLFFALIPCAVNSPACFIRSSCLYSSVFIRFSGLCLKRGNDGFQYSHFCSFKRDSINHWRGHSAGFIALGVNGFMDIYCSIHFFWGRLCLLSSYLVDSNAAVRCISRLCDGFWTVSDRIVYYTWIVF